MKLPTIYLDSNTSNIAHVMLEISSAIKQVWRIQQPHLGTKCDTTVVHASHKVAAVCTQFKQDQMAKLSSILFWNAGLHHNRDSFRFFLVWRQAKKLSYLPTIPHVIWLNIYIFILFILVTHLTYKNEPHLNDLCDKTLYLHIYFNTDNGEISALKTQNFA